MKEKEEGDRGEDGRQTKLSFRSSPGSMQATSPKRSEIYAILDPLSTESKLFMMAKTTQTVTRRYISLYFTQLKEYKPLLERSGFDSDGNQTGPFIKKTLS